MEQIVNIQSTSSTSLNDDKISDKFGGEQTTDSPLRRPNLSSQAICGGFQTRKNWGKRCLEILIRSFLFC